MSVRVLHFAESGMEGLILRAHAAYRGELRTERGIWARVSLLPHDAFEYED